MEYVNHRGTFDDVPLARIRADFERQYPRWLDSAATTRQVEFLDDVALETGTPAPADIGAAGRHR